MAWVAFAILFLAIAGGIGGLYAHRQNQEKTKLQLITELESEITQLNERTNVLVNEFKKRIEAPQLKLAVGQKKMPIDTVPYEHRHNVVWAVPTEVPSEPPAPGTEPSAVLATIPPHR